MRCDTWPLQQLSEFIFWWILDHVTTRFSSFFVVLVGVLLVHCYICLEKQKPNIFGKCTVSNRTVAAVQPRNKIPNPSTRIQTVQDQKKNALFTTRFFLQNSQTCYLPLLEHLWQHVHWKGQNIYQASGFCIMILHILTQNFQ